MPTYQDLTYALFTHWPLKVKVEDKTYSLIVTSLHHPGDFFVTFRGITADGVVCEGTVNVDEHSKDFQALTFKENA